MTKKDYELIAKPFNKEITRLAVLEAEAQRNSNQQLQDEHNQAKTTLILFVDKLANELKTDNHSFDYDKFLNAAGVLNNPHDIESQA